MAQKTLNTRISHKHDTEEHWLQAVNFRPLPGELIIYDADNTHPFPRFKIGDENRTLINDLPFIYELITEADIEEICGNSIISISEVSW